MYFHFSLSLSFLSFFFFFFSSRRRHTRCSRDWSSDVCSSDLDLAFPYLMVQRGRRAVYEPEAIAFEKPSRDIEDEYARKVRMFEHCWLIVAEGDMLRGLDPVYRVEIVSHRHLRYGSGLLHLVLLGSSATLAPRGGVYRAALGAQLAFLAAAAARPGLPPY